jgi:hypothetical protein
MHRFAFCFPFAVLLAAQSKPNYAEHIAPILHKNCAGCHRPGEAAPFSLLTYEDAAKHARVIAAVTAAKRMPPWKAEDSSFAYRDDRRLKAADLTLLQAWVKAGAPQGDPRKAPPPPQFPKGWQLGTPDRVSQMEKPFTVPAEGPDVYKYIRFPVGADQDLWIRAVELRPSARRAVHHVLYFAEPAEDAVKAEAAIVSTGMRVGPKTIPLGGWAVGGQPHLLPDGLAMLLPKGYDLTVQFHFHPTGKVENEQSSIGLYTAAAAPKKQIASVQLPPLFGVFAGVNIPAGESAFTVRDSFTLPIDVEAFSTGAHAHYLGRKMRLTATLPDGSVKTLLSIGDWDFAWQDRYFFEGYVSLPKGTRLDGEVVWDNSPSNPRNPKSPPVAVAWGEESGEEMGSVSVAVVAKNEDELSMLQDAFRKHVRGAAMSRMMKDPAYMMKLAGRFGMNRLP